MLSPIYAVFSITIPTIIGVQLSLLPIQTYPFTCKQPCVWTVVKEFIAFTDNQLIDEPTNSTGCGPVLRLPRDSRWMVRSYKRPQPSHQPTQRALTKKNETGDQFNNFAGGASGGRAAAAGTLKYWKCVTFWNRTRPQVNLSEFKPNFNQ